MIRRGRTINIPFPRVKGGYCGHGLGSLVTCRHLPSVSWRLLTISGLDIPVPGVRSRMITLSGIRHREWFKVYGGFPVWDSPWEGAVRMCPSGLLRDAGPAATSLRQVIYTWEKWSIPFWTGVKDTGQTCGAWRFVRQKGKAEIKGGKGACPYAG